MNEQRKALLRSPWIYLLATFAWTWFFWGIGILMGFSMEAPAGGILLLLGVAGPMITGIVFTYLTRDKAGRRDYWKRIIDIRRIPARWFLVILLFTPILNLLAGMIDMLAGGTGATWALAASMSTSSNI